MCCNLMDVPKILMQMPGLVRVYPRAGVLGFFQTYVLDCMSNLWFDRMDNNDRSAMSRKIKEHIQVGKGAEGHVRGRLGVVY